VTRDVDDAAAISDQIGTSVNVPHTPAKRLKGTAKPVITAADELLSAVNRGGLSHPTIANFTICALTYMYFRQLENDHLKDFLNSGNHRETFIKAMRAIITTNASFACLLELKCVDGHNVFDILVKCFFNCCATNMRRRLFKDVKDELAKPGENDAQRKKLRKLQSKSSEKV
jgi:hypothetical protein